MNAKTENTMRLERTFDATPERLWAAWTDPKAYAKWLNPSGIDLVIHEFDVRPGGRVRFDMPQPDGNPHPQEGIFHTLVPYREIVSGNADRSFLLRVTFEAQGARTHMVVEITGVPPDWHEAATTGWGKGFDQLAAVLASADTRTLRLERVFACSRSEMWAAWTRPEALARWFGPMVAVNEMDEMDVRVGGRFRLAMRADDGKRHPLSGSYLVVDEPTELAFSAEATELRGHVSTVRVQFMEDGDCTRVAIEQTGLPTDVADETGKGWSLSWDKLDAVLAAKDREIVLTRLLDAPRERVFDAYTDPAAVSKWWGPRGFTTTTHEMDVRVGGRWRFTMHGPDGKDHSNLVEYEEVERPWRLVFRHGSDDEPAQFHVTVTFVEEGGRTRLAQRMRFPTPEARKAVDAFGAVELGMQTLEKLADHLAAMHKGGEMT